MKPNQLIAITSDFGSELGCVGQMKGVMLSINPRARLCDVTHSVPPWDIHHASYVVEQSCKYFPKGTIHLAVVDPGVGTFRAGVIVQTETDYYIGPDNGLLSFVEEDDILGIWRIENPRFQLPKVSATFHGRDIFGPAAAFLSLGVPPEKFGPSHSKLIRLSKPGLSSTEDGGLIGRVIAVDRFGNLITDIREEDLLQLKNGSKHATFQVRLGNHKLPMLRTFADAPLGEALAFLGANDRIEVAINAASAAQHFQAAVGTRIEVTLHERPPVILRKTQTLSMDALEPAPTRRDNASELSMFFPTKPTRRDPGKTAENRDSDEPPSASAPTRRSGLFARPKDEPPEQRKTTPYVVRRKKNTDQTSRPTPPPLPSNPIAERKRAYRAVAEEQRRNAALSTPGYENARLQAGLPQSKRVEPGPEQPRKRNTRPGGSNRAAVAEKQPAIQEAEILEARETMTEFEEGPSLYEQSLLEQQQSYVSEETGAKNQDYENEDFFVEDDYFTTDNFLDPEKYFNPDY